MNLNFLIISLMFLINCYAININIRETKEANDYIRKWRIANEVPGLVSGVSVKGNTLWTKTLGLTDIENNVRTRIDSEWRMASISKSLTSAIVGKLIDRGLLDLNNSINAYISTDIFPVKQWNGINVTITVRQCLSHTAGLRSITDNDLYTIKECNTVTQTIAQFKDTTLVAEPGTTYVYSQFGYQIIGAIIESICNESYEKVANTMFAELNMKSTFAERHELIIPHRAHYYRKNNDTNYILSNEQLFDDLLPIECYWPAGGLVSIVPDLLRFGYLMCKSFNGHTGFLTQSTVQQLWTPNTVNTFGISADNSTPTYYCLGWQTRQLSPPIQVSNSRTPSIKYMVFNIGGLTGVATLLAIFPEQEFVVSVLTNFGQPTQYTNALFIDLAISLAKIFL